jgi:Cu-Zn family superoxide dismutase
MQILRRKMEARARWVGTAALIGAALLSSCKWRSADTPSETQSAQVEGAGSDPSTADRAVARLKPTEGNEVSGTVHFEQTGDGVRVSAVVTGLDPNSVHGFHIHEKGDCSAPDASSAGGHYSPKQHAHGLPTAETRHAGDMGNLVVDGDGNVAFDRTFDTFSVQGAEAPIVGRAVIVHAQQDDGSQPTGNAGPRLACGVIEALETVGE